VLVFLHGDSAILAARMGHRPGHFMPVDLLESQLATLEEPGDDEHALRFDVAVPADRIVTEAAAALAVADDAAGAGS
jgi:gluconate kinase